MKAKKALGMALALASALFFVACSNMDSGSVDNGAAYLYSANRTLNISVDGVDLSDGSGVGVYDPWINRTVLPTDAYTTDPSKSSTDQYLTLVLKAISNGKNVSYHVLTGGTQEVAPGDPKKTDFTLTLPAASYDFWLYAYKTADISDPQKGNVSFVDPAAPTEEEAKAVVDASDINNPSTGKLTTAFWAHGAQDLTNGTASSISFTLTPIDLKGNGNINIAGAFFDPDGIVDGIKIGIYNIYTNEVVQGKIGNASAALETDGSYTKKRTVAPSGSDHGTPNYFGKLTSSAFNPPASGDIDKKYDGDADTHVVAVDDAWKVEAPAGSYRAAITFYSGTKEVGYWSDLVIVEPTNSSNSLDIEFDGINTRPAAPTGLTAYLVKDSYKKNDQVNGKYDVELTWKDNASNEKGYLIRVTEYSINGGATSVSVVPGANTAAGVNPVILGFAPATNAYDVDAAKPIKALTDPALGFFTQTATPATNLLLSQCESVTLTLDTGKLYDFEVVAYNAIGYSEYVPGFGVAGATPYEENAVTTDGFANVATGGDNYYGNFMKDLYWTPRKLNAGEATFGESVANKMAYKQAKAEDADPVNAATDYSAVSSGSFDSTATYYKKTGTTSYEIAYITAAEFVADGSLYTLAAGKGKPFTPFMINLYAIEYNLSGGKLYQESKVLNGNHFNFYRFGNDTPSLKNAFGAVVTNKLSSVTPLTNPVTADDITPTDAGSATEPFIVKWNTSNSAYSNWQAWYRQSQTKDGTTSYYKSPKVPADILKFNEEGGYANQVVYATYAGNESPLTIVVGIDSAAAGANDINDTYLTAQAVAKDDGSTTTGQDIAKTPDAETVVKVAATPNPTNSVYRYLYLKLDTTTSGSVPYTAVKYYVNRVEQSNIDEDGCYVDLTQVGEKITVMVCGYIGGRWYSRSFGVVIDDNSI